MTRNPNRKSITVADLMEWPPAMEMVVELLNDIADQIPEKPDYWSSCGQCETNINRVDAIIDEIQERG